jgi:hypothetical protein
MATTPNYGWVTPAPTDFVTDLPADFEVFADAVDASFAADEGDLLVGGSSNIFEALPIGAAGTVLRSDGDTAEWAALSSAPDSWSLVNAGGTSLNGVNTVTISGISDANMLYIIVNGFSTAGNYDDIRLRLNADTGNNYNAYGVFSEPDSEYTRQAHAVGRVQSNADHFELGAMGFSQLSEVSGAIMIYGTNGSGIKTMNRVFGQDNSSTSEWVSRWGFGHYTGTSAITSVTIYVGSGANGDDGTVFVYKA